MAELISPELRSRFNRHFTRTPDQTRFISWTTVRLVLYGHSKGFRVNQAPEVFKALTEGCDLVARGPGLYIVKGWIRVPGSEALLLNEPTPTQEPWGQPGLPDQLTRIQQTLQELRQAPILSAPVPIPMNDHGAMSDEITALRDQVAGVALEVKELRESLDTLRADSRTLGNGQCDTHDELRREILLGRWCTHVAYALALGCPPGNLPVQGRIWMDQHAGACARLNIRYEDLKNALPVFVDEKSLTHSTTAKENSNSP
jgi:hypothetical protein